MFGNLFKERLMVIFQRLNGDIQMIFVSIGRNSRYSVQTVQLHARSHREREKKLNELTLVSKNRCLFN